jgi:cytochrome b
MNTHLHPAAQTSETSAPTASTRGRRVNDAPLRMFHWLFASSFVGAWVTADVESWRALHITLGYTLGGLLAFRVVYGLVGPRRARLGLLWRRLQALPAWWQAMKQHPARGPLPWRQGQNLLMSGVIVTLLLTPLPLLLSGLATEQDWGGEWLAEAHEVLGNTLMVLVFAHLGLLVALSIWRGRNQALPMLRGRAPEPGPDLVPRQRHGLALLLLLAVLAFGTWQWQAAPNGLWPGDAAPNAGQASGAAPDRDQDHDD